MEPCAASLLVEGGAAGWSPRSCWSRPASAWPEPSSRVAVGALLGGLPARPRGARGARAACRLRALAAANGAGLAALTLCALIQHLDVVVAQHRLDDAAAGAYAAAAVAPKMVVWVAVGLSLALLPELSRHARSGGADRGRLVRTLVLVALVSAPLVLVCALAAGPVLRVVFGDGLDGAAEALPWLALAMALFACAAVAVQHALARRPPTVVVLVAAAAVAEPLVLRAMDAAAPDLAHGVAGIQLAIAAAVIALARRPRAADARRRARERPTAARPTGLARVRELWGLFRNEREDPAPFYTWLARRARRPTSTARHGALARPGRRSISAAGPGYYTRGAARPRRRPSSPSTTAPTSGGRAAARGRDARGRGARCRSRRQRPRHRLLEPARARAGQEAVIREMERVLSPAAGATCRGRTGTRRAAATT